MLNALSLNAVKSSQFSPHSVKPLYASYCFANLPATIQYLLTGQGQSTLPGDVFGHLPTRYNKVVLFFVDAFGWRFFNQHADNYPLLKTFLQQGMVSKLTSQFPSTTPAHVTCINTGLAVAQSGVYEWFYYEPLVDAVISPLRFSFAGDNRTDTLKTTAIPPETFYPTQTLHRNLQSLGVQSHIFQPSALVHSTYSNLVFKGATSVNPYHNLEDALNQLTTHVLAKEESPAYYLFYYDRIDATSHLYGPDSPELAEELDYFFLTVEQLFYRKLYKLTGDTLLMLTADHGQIAVSPDTTIYLNLEMPEIIPYLQTNRLGQLLIPAGSARDMFLHVKDELLEEGLVLLQQFLGTQATVYRTSELIEQKFFGLGPPSPTFLSRVGNLVILPAPQETVWWFEQRKFAMRFSGHHGGLTPEEMEIPLLLLPL